MKQCTYLRVERKGGWEVSRDTDICFKWKRVSVRTKEKRFFSKEEEITGIMECCVTGDENALLTVTWGQWREQFHNYWCSILPASFLPPFWSCLREHRLWDALPRFGFWFCHWLNPQKYFISLSVTFFICEIRVIITSPHRILPSLLSNFISTVYHYNFLVFTLNSLDSPSPLGAVLTLQYHALVNHNPPHTLRLPFCSWLELEKNSGPRWLTCLRCRTKGHRCALKNTQMLYCIPLDHLLSHPARNNFTTNSSSICLYPHSQLMDLLFTSLRK